MEIIDTLNLKLGKIEDHSLLVIQITHGLKDFSDVEIMCAHLNKIVEKYKDKLDVLVIGKDMTVELAPESHMNKLGWYRKDVEGNIKEVK